MALCSLAMAAGIVGVVALVRGVVFRRHLGGRGCGPHGFAGETCGGGGGSGRSFGRWGGWRRVGGGRGGIGRSFWLRALFARLDTTPGQEREIRAAIEDLRDRARDAKAGLKEARENAGKALARDVFDDTAFEAVNARVDASAEKVKDAVASALKRVHGVLDPKQRERLAEIVGKGFGPWGRGGFRGHGGPYRGGAEV
jgi:Spy/CpxP family protein refolding chaperone